MNNDKRDHQRHEKEEIIYIEVLASNRQSNDDNQLLECSTKDISREGLQIQAKYPFIVNSLLELLISFDTGGYKFLLTGEVKWVEELAENEKLAGFQLIDSEHSDITVWRNMFLELEKK